MSITRQVTVWCDICQNWEMETTEKPARARRRLKHKGWTRLRIDGELRDVCPDCKEKIKCKTVSHV